MLIKCPDSSSFDRTKLTIFLAGPIQGATDWQSKFANQLGLDINIMSPRRNTIDRSKFDYEEQFNWETYYLNRADAIVFCIPEKSEEVDGRDYAQTTRFELGEWMANSLKYANKPIFIYADESISGIRYFKKKATTQYQSVKWFNQYNDLLLNVRAYLKGIIDSNPKIFFTADTHFSSQRTLELSKRPFLSTDHMDDIMVNNWNSVVKPNDIVYHLGDFGNFDIVQHLNGTIRLILGNYEEKDITEGKYTQEDLLKYFDSVNKTGYFYTEEYGDIFMIHCPVDCVSDRFNLFGHIHGRQMIKKFGLDVGVDCHNYTPVSWEDCNFFLNAIKQGYYDKNVYIQ